MRRNIRVEIKVIVIILNVYGRPITYKVIILAVKKKFRDSQIDCYILLMFWNTYFD